MGLSGREEQLEMEIFKLSSVSVQFDVSEEELGDTHEFSSIKLSSSGSGSWITKTATAPSTDTIPCGRTNIRDRNSAVFLVNSVEGWKTLSSSCMSRIFWRGRTRWGPRLEACVRAFRTGRKQKLPDAVPRLKWNGYSIPCSWERWVVVGILTHQCPSTKLFHLKGMVIISSLHTPLSILVRRHFCTSAAEPDTVGFISSMKKQFHSLGCQSHVLY